MTRRRLAALLAAGAFAVAVGAATIAGAASWSKASATGVTGDFSLVMMVHTGSSSFGELPNVRAWNGRLRRGTTFTYRSIPCTGNAPVNNIASDLPSYNARVRGSRVPSSMRAHPYRFKLTKRDGRWEMVGQIIFTVCKLGPGPTASDDPVPDARKPKIYVRFRARPYRASPEAVRWAGTFRITGGTQRYVDLEGSGRIAGYHFCFHPDGCAELGGDYRDGQFVMQGSYRDPTPDLSSAP